MNAQKTRQHSPSLRRTIVMAIAGLIAAVVVGFTIGWVFAPLIGWAVACAVHVAWVWIALARRDGPQTRELATREDPRRSTTDTLLLVAAIASLAALLLVEGQAHSASASTKPLLAGLVVGSVALSWFLIHTLFTLRYAVLYYEEGDRPIDFNEDTLPRFADFAYLSFTVGMTFQVSDTDISSQKVRAVILRHMLLSYLFGAVILAVSVNVIASLAQ